MDRAEQELYGASVHVNYEVEMLKAMTSFLCEFPERTAEGIWRRNAYSVLFHGAPIRASEMVPNLEP
jgi:hypothetical protein